MFNISGNQSEGWNVAASEPSCHSSRSNVWKTHDCGVKTKYNGVFLKDPHKAAQLLKRPSAPKQEKTAVWPESFSCYDFKAILKSKSMQRSASCGVGIGKL